MILRVLFGLFCVLPSLAFAAGGFSHSVTFQPESRDSIEISTFTDNSPTVGFLPLRVVIDNRGGSDQTWELFPQSRGSDWITGSWTFTVEAGQRGEYEIMVPLKSSGFNYRWGGQYLWGGPGIEVGHMQLPQTSSSSSSSPAAFVGLSDSLHIEYWGKLTSTSSDVVGGSVDWSKASTDWRAYSGFDQLWLTQREWIGLSSPVRQAVRESLALGGYLVLVCADADEEQAVFREFGRPADSKDRWEQGAAKIRIMKVNDKTPLNGARIMSVYKEAGSSADRLSKTLRSSFFDAEVEAIQTAGPLVLLFILVFGIVAGPLNLFVLAPAKRRHRLFITTPLISLIGAAVLAAVIFIQDGVGGQGARIIYAQVLPDLKRMVISQEQASRTGLLLGTAFQTDDPLWMQQVNDASSSGMGFQSQRFQMEGDLVRSGDWFSSRSRQSQVLQAVRPTRAAVEWTLGSPPSIVSALEADLDVVFVVDPEGNFWRGTAVRPGERATLQASNRNELREWKSLFKKRYDPGAHIQFTMNRGEEALGWFYAETKDDRYFAIETLKSIRWQSSGVIVSGPLSIKTSPTHD